MIKWTDDLTNKLLELYPVNSCRFISEMIGVPVPSIKAKVKNMGLKHARGYNRMNNSVYSVTADEKQFIIDNYFKYTNHELAKKIGRSESTIQKVRKEFGLEGKENTGCFKKGSVPANKGKKMPVGWSTPAMKRTQFKKGDLPKNTKSDGEISIRTNYKRNKKYYYKRIHGKWRELHRLIWEEKYGPIPKGFNVQFRDGNTLNCKIENLYLIKRTDQMKQNSIHRYTPEVKSAIRLVGKLKRKIKKHEQQN